MQTSTEKNIVILGISKNPERYSFKAMNKLLDSGYTNITGINPAAPNLEKINIAKSIDEINEPIDTLTVYISKNKLDDFTTSILNKNPKRVILNPGTENDSFEKAAKEKGIDVMRACTLVLLSTGEF